MEKKNVNERQYGMTRSCYPLDEYKMAYQVVRRMICDAETLMANNEEDIEKCMWIAAMADVLSEVPATVVQRVSGDVGISRDTKSLVRKEFPRKRDWHKYYGEAALDIVIYSMIYERICCISRDTDDFNPHNHVSDEVVRKCEWIVAVREVVDEAVQKFVTPILNELKIEYDWLDFYNNYYFE